MNTRIERIIAPLLPSNSGTSSKRIQLWELTILGVMLVALLQALQPDWCIIPNCGEEGAALLFLAIFAVSLGCEFVDSSLGMGYGTALTPILLIVGFKPLEIVPCILFSECLTGLSAFVMHHLDGNINFVKSPAARRTAMLLSILSFAGALIAVFFALSIPEYWLKVAISAIVFIAGVVVLLTAGRRLNFRPVHVTLVGGIAAFNKAVSGGGYGPLVTAGQVVSGVEAREAVAITSLAESVTCLVGFTSYMVLDGHLNVSLLLPLTLGALFSVPVSTLTVSRLSDKTMRACVGVASVVLAIVALLKVL